MRTFLGLALLALSATAFRTDYHLSEEDFEMIYGGKTDDAELEQRKAQRLAEAEQEINEQNLAFEHGEATFFEELNADSDKPIEIFQEEKLGALSKDEVRGLGALYRSLDDPHRVDPYSEAFLKAMMQQAEASRQTAPASYDSRSYGKISSVKNQQQCGSCAAFSSVGAIETCMFSNNGGKAHTDLSEETLLDCGYNGKGMNGCNGAYPEDYLQFATTLNNGLLPHEITDPYMNTKPYLTCRNKTPLNWGAKVSDRVYTYACNETYMKQLIWQYGAVVAELNASGPGFGNYGGGIYSNQCSGTIDHAVLAVGYGVDSADGRTYFIVKNSWGTGWGEGGFFRIKVGTCSFGQYCAVPKCTNTGKFDTEPQPPVTTSCDVNSYWGALNGGYSSTIDNVKRDFTCSGGICIPNVLPQPNYPNACSYVCGSNTCGVAGTVTTTTTTTTAAPPSATCDVTKKWGSLTGSYTITYSSDNIARNFNCNQGICTPSPAQPNYPNACMYICNKSPCT